MSLVAYTGIAVTVLGLVIVIQTLRLKAAKKDLTAAKEVAKAAHAALGSAEQRLGTERKNAASWKRRSREVEDDLLEAMGALNEQSKEVDKERDEVRDAAGDDAAILDIVRRSLADDGEPAVPARVPGDRDWRSDDPV